MKKFLFLILLGLPLLFLGGCSIINNDDSGINNGDLEDQQLSGLPEQPSGLQDGTNQEDTKKIIGEYSMIDGSIYSDGNKIYGENLQSKSFCDSNLETRCRYGTNIIAENDEYLLFTAVESFYGQINISYLLDKNTNISQAFELGDKLYSFDDFDGENLYINVYSGRILGGNGAITEKGYYSNYACDECEIQFIEKLQVALNNMKNYQINEIYKLIP